MKRPWFPFYVGDFVADTMTLSEEEVGTYLRLLLAQFRCDRIATAYATAYAKWDAVSRYFETETINGVEYVYSQRMREEIAKGREISEKNRKNAKMRWSSGENNAYSDNATAMRPQCDRNATAYAKRYAKPMPSQSQSHSQPKTQKEKMGEEERDVARPTGGQPAQFSFPLDSGKTWNLKPEDLLALEEAFPEIDVSGEMRKAASWLNANPSRRKTAKGMPRFINGWLQRTGERAASQATAKVSRVLSNQSEFRVHTEFDDVWEVLTDDHRHIRFEDENGNVIPSEEFNRRLSIQEPDAA